MSIISLSSRRCEIATVLMMVSLVLAGASLVATQPPQGGQTEFVPIDELPPEEQLPAAPLLIGAYAFVWVALVIYLWSIWQRMGKVERELNVLARQTAQKRP